jgi:hypothetical protein
MMSILKAILDFFKAEKTVYSHRNRTIEIIALEKGININSIKEDTKVILENKGRVEAIINLRKRFHVTTSAAWRFVDKLDLK